MKRHCRRPIQCTQPSCHLSLRLRFRWQRCAVSLWQLFMHVTVFIQMNIVQEIVKCQMNATNRKRMEYLISIYAFCWSTQYALLGERMENKFSIRLICRLQSITSPWRLQVAHVNARGCQRWTTKSISPSNSKFSHEANERFNSPKNQFCFAF